MRAQDWHRELAKHPTVIRLERLLRSRRDNLDKDKLFLRETEKLKHRLERAFSERPEKIRLFFRQFRFPFGPRLREIRRFLEDPKNKKIRPVLRHYVRYAARFGVTMQLKTRKPNFRVELEIPWGSKFHVKVMKGYFRPAGSYPGGDVPYEYFFESEKLRVPAPLESLIQTGSAKFVQIEDNSWSSVLSRLEYFAYHADGVSFVLHKAEQPYIICFIGEKVSQEIWRKAGRAISALQRRHYGRGKAGRPPDIGRYRKAIKLLRRHGLLKQAAPALSRGTTEKDFHSAEAFISRVRKSLK